MTHHANGDADLLIVKTAKESAHTETTVLVEDDTDLPVFWSYHTPEGGHDLYFWPEPKANASGARVWHVRKVKEELGTDLCENRFFSTCCYRM